MIERVTLIALGFFLAMFLVTGFGFGQTPTPAPCETQLEQTQAQMLQARKDAGQWQYSAASAQEAMLALQKQVKALEAKVAAAAPPAKAPEKK